MRKNGRQAEKAGFLIDACGLDCRDLMPTKTFPDNVQSAGQRGIAEGGVRLAREGRSDGGDKGFFWEFFLRRVGGSLVVFSLLRSSAQFKVLSVGSRI